MRRFGSKTRGRAPESHGGELNFSEATPATEAQRNARIERGWSLRELLPSRRAQAGMRSGGARRSRRRNRTAGRRVPERHAGRTATRGLPLLRHPRQTPAAAERRRTRHAVALSRRPLQNDSNAASVACPMLGHHRETSDGTRIGPQGRHRRRVDRRVGRRAVRRDRPARNRLGRQHIRAITARPGQPRRPVSRKRRTMRSASHKRCVTSAKAAGSTPRWRAGTPVSAPRVR